MILRALIAFSIAPMLLSAAKATTLVIDGVISSQSFDGGPQAGESFSFSLDIPSTDPDDRANAANWGLYTSGNASMILGNGMTGSLEDVTIEIHVGAALGFFDDVVVIRTNMLADAGSGLSLNEYWFQHLDFRFAFLGSTFSGDAFENYRFLVSGQEPKSTTMSMIWDIDGSGGTGLSGEVQNARLIPEPNPTLLTLLSLLAVTFKRRRAEPQR